MTYVVMVGEAGSRTGRVVSVTVNSMEAWSEAREVTKTGAFVWVERWDVTTGKLWRIYDPQEWATALVNIARGDEE